MAAGELSSRERIEVDRAIRAAEQASRFEYSVYIGPSDGGSREHAQRLHAALVIPRRSVLVFVDPDARVLEVVTGADVRRQLSDAEVAAAVVTMQSEFAQGRIVEGLVRGLANLGEHARPPRTLHAES